MPWLEGFSILLHSQHGLQAFFPEIDQCHHVLATMRLPQSMSLTLGESRDQTLSFPISSRQTLLYLLKTAAMFNA